MSVLTLVVGHRVDEGEQLGPEGVVARACGGAARPSPASSARAAGPRSKSATSSVDGVDLGDRLEPELGASLEGADGPLDLDGVLLLEEGGELLDLVEGAPLQLARSCPGR